MSAVTQSRDDELGVGTLIESRFRLEAVIGTGAMGAVFRATQLSLDRSVAVKVLRAGAQDAAARRRFEDEAKILSKLDHPGIVRILDFGMHAERPFLVMDLVEGKSLESMLRGGAALEPAEAVGLATQICAALAHAHRAGVIHRDLKPENVIVTAEGRARVVDFGIARLVGAEAESRPALTTAGMVVGTPEYVSPEQAMGEPLDARSDLYALGVVTYRMLCGELPFSGGTAGELLAKHTQDPVPPLADKVPPFVRPLADVVHRLLAKRPADRFATAEAVSAALAEAFEAGRREGGGPGDGEAAGAPGAAEVSAGDPSAGPSSSMPAGPTGGTRATAVKTANLTVLFVAMDEFAERMTRLDYEAQAALAAIFDALTVPVAKRYGGRKVKTVQESQLFTFPSPTAAMKAAAAIQDRAARYSRAADDALAVRLSIGAASGEVRLSGDDVFGEPVNLAARVKGLAEPGEILLTGGIHLSMNRAEVRSDPLGRRTFKGIPEPVDVHRLVRWPAAADPYGGDALDALRLPDLDGEDARALASGWLAYRMHRLTRGLRRRSARGGEAVAAADVRGEPAPGKLEAAKRSAGAIGHHAAVALRRHGRTVGLVVGALLVVFVLVLAVRGISGRVGAGPAPMDVETARASLAELEAKVRDDPDDVDARAAYAHALTRAGRGEQAVAHYLRVANADAGALGRAHLDDLVRLLGIFGEATGDAESALLKVGRPAIRPLRAVWEDEDAGRYLRRRAGQVLVVLGEDVDLVPIWIATLDSDQCGAQQLAARELARLGDMRAVEPLRGASRRGCLAGRRAAQQALSTLNP